MTALETFRFATETRNQLAANILQFVDRRQEATDLRGAAIAVTVFNDHGEAAIVLTRRAPTLRNHGGQWALPGGRIDQGEGAVEAALRELREEIGLCLDETAVIGTLDDYLTRSGYRITPVVIWAEVGCAELVPNPEEVASIHAFSFPELMRKDSPHLESIPQSERQVLSMHYGQGRIYAPTAAVLYQFREVAMCGRETRVLHYDQPVFAWQ